MSTRCHSSHHASLPCCYHMLDSSTPIHCPVYIFFLASSFSLLNELTPRSNWISSDRSYAPLPRSPARTSWPLLECLSTVSIKIRSTVQVMGKTHNMFGSQLQKLHADALAIHAKYPGFLSLDSHLPSPVPFAEPEFALEALNVSQQLPMSLWHCAYPQFTD